MGFIASTDTDVYGAYPGHPHRHPPRKARAKGKIYANCVSRYGAGDERCMALKAEAQVIHVESLEQAETNPRRKRKLKALKKKIRRQHRKAAKGGHKPPMSFGPQHGHPPQSAYLQHAMRVERDTPRPRPELSGLLPASIGVDPYRLALSNARAILNYGFAGIEQEALDAEYGEAGYAARHARKKKRLEKRKKRIERRMTRASGRRAGRQEVRGMRQDVRADRKAYRKAISGRG
jgi:hypothetical protein